MRTISKFLLLILLTSLALNPALAVPPPPEPDSPPASNDFCASALQAAQDQCNRIARTVVDWSCDSRTFTVTYHCG